MLLVQDGFEPHSTSNSGTRLDTSPGDPVVLVNSISAADFDLSRDQETNNLPMNAPNSITIDAIEAAFPNEPIMMDESWGYPIPQFLEGFDWQLPTLGVENWLEDVEGFSLENENWSHNPLFAEIDSTSQMDVAITMMRDFFQRRSRAPSPMREEPRQLWNQWYSAPPHLQIYDEEVINILLNLARTHLSSTFAIFSDFEVLPDTKEELCLAMAAVGGLFCTVSESAKVARKLYNDARRMQLEAMIPPKPTYFRAAMDRAKTSILLEIYGICSGDKRSYELTEAYHSETLRTIRSCWLAAFDGNSAERESQLQLLSRAAHVLDSYRVLLLLRAPSFFEATLANGHLGDHDNESFQRSTSHLRFLMSPSCVNGETSSSLETLAEISSYTWALCPHGLAHPSEQLLWKHDFIELGLERWNQSRMMNAEFPTQTHFATMLLYHLTHINLHSNLRILQRSAKDFIDSANSPEPGKVSHSIATWTSTSHFDVASWHSEAIQSLVREAMSTARRRTQFHADKSHLLESPHLPFCIYFSTLVLWYGAGGKSGSDASGDVVIDNGSQLLLALKVKVAKHLASALNDLLSDHSK
ncbi:uncharacterized protein A1O9_03368 [Exophiala aquamarina CBS 119918]|uniref:Transcription factor domain-containing protein n=1 Tax=Exophiala aquamarina CBS 119918 TaxID=1182545 RepID=A0A072PR69_9EURO|nr:uncharacterized protein A1O9_03368 [Exophiala aquamarina CBS 119918]KEF61798.1 hypothetical protein A1O9_03368 [Exophiala aquamarina CBS 119918]